MAYRTTTDDTIYARSLLKGALRRGDLVRPERCEACGKKPEPTADGRAAILACRRDLAAPLVVDWLCHICIEPHMRRRRREANPSARLDTARVEEIRRRWRMGGETKKGLAREFGVYDRTIRLIVEEVTWL